MRTIAVLLVIVSGVLSAQETNDFRYLTRKTTPQVFNSGIYNRTYTASTKDTTIAYDITGFKNVYVSVQSQDSASCIIKYQLSIDSVSSSSIRWGAITTKDSLATAAASGDLKSVDLTAQVLGARMVRFILDFTSGATQGTTSNTYSAAITRKQD